MHAWVPKIFYYNQNGGESILIHVLNKLTPEAVACSDLRRRQLFWDLSVSHILYIWSGLHVQVSFIVIVYLFGAKLNFLVIFAG